MKSFFIYFLFGLFMFSICPDLNILKASNKQFTVVIDAGHGGKDAGAIGSVLKLKEKNINLAVALELGRLLDKEKDVKVIYTRKTDVFVPLDERPKIANKAKADLFISIHANAAKNKSAYGTETYVVGASSSNMEVAMRENSVILYEDDYKTRYEGFDPNSSESYIMFDFMQFAFMDQSLSLASYVQDQFRTVCNRSDRGVKRAGFLVLKQTSMPGILVELGYISNPKEEKYLNQDKSKKELAKAIYNAFLSYKYSYEKKSNVVFEDEKNEFPSREENNKDNSEQNEVVYYSVQFCSSKISKPLDCRDFKICVPAKEYQENGIYKYMYGNVSSYAEAIEVRKNVQKYFGDAFIVVFKNDKKLSQREAQAYFK